MSHTPGKWAIGEYNHKSGRIHIYDCDEAIKVGGGESKIICEVLDEDVGQEVHPNARLIAAAPELLAAYKMALEIIGELREPADFQVAHGMDLIAGIIAKAKGETQ